MTPASWSSPNAAQSPLRRPRDRIGANGNEEPSPLRRPRDCVGSNDTDGRAPLRRRDGLDGSGERTAGDGATAPFKTDPGSERGERGGIVGSSFPTDDAAALVATVGTAAPHPAEQLR